MTTGTQLERVTKRPEYLAIAATRRKWVTPSFIVQALPPPPESIPAESMPAETIPAEIPPAESEQNDATSDFVSRVGFTVSKKVGNAVKRNRARRRLKEAAQAAFRKHGTPGWAYVVIGRPAAISYDFEKMQADMRWALAKLASGADLKPRRSAQNKPDGRKKTTDRETS